MAEAARKVAKDADLDVKVWTNGSWRGKIYGLVQVGKGSAHRPD